MRRRDLVERAMSGDLEAFSELMSLRIDELYGIARLVLRDADKARDATQEALVAAWRDLSGLRDPDRFDAWLRRLLVNACYREARRNQRRARFEVRAAPVEALHKSLPDPAVAVVERDQLERAFRHLDPGQRAMIVMRYYLDLSLQETADSLGLPLGTVKSRLHRTTQQLRATLDSDARSSPGQSRSDWRTT
jgi:RNA polymerase sigma-70 factor (ECF subfamily)